MRCNNLFQPPTAPKPKGGQKKNAKTKTPVVIDGVSTDDMSKEQVNHYISCKIWFPNQYHKLSSFMYLAQVNFSAFVVIYLIFLSLL